MFLLKTTLLPLVLVLMSAQANPTSSEKDERVPGEFYFKGDMKLFRPYEDAQSRAGVQGVIFNGKLHPMKWPKNRIPYKFDSTVVPETRAMLKQAMKDVENVVPDCWKFEPANGDEFHVIFTSKDPSACFASLGYTKTAYGGKNQDANFGTWCKPGNVVHELLHTLGFHHEQTRDDRDDYIRVHWENIPKDWVAQFWKNGELIKDENGEIQQYPYNTSYYKVPYNFDSIMQYPGDSFDGSDKESMTSLGNPKAWGNDKEMGQRNRFSKGDILMIARHGGCSVDSNPAAVKITGAKHSDTAKPEGAPIIPIPTKSPETASEGTNVNVATSKDGMELALNFLFKNNPKK